jgi:2-dehydro-3-deoxyglucarate aldolase
MYNPLRSALENGRRAVGVAVVTRSPTFIEVCGEYDLDFVWIDFEHGSGNPWDGDALMDLSRSAELADLELMVRVPPDTPGLIGRILDTGVRTILLPRVETASEVEAAIRAAQYHYDDSCGSRGLAGTRSDGWGTMENATHRSDQTVLVGAMIENMNAIENLEEILEVSGLGFVFVGPEDLSLSLGSPRDFTNPELWDVIDEVFAQAEVSDVPVAMPRLNVQGSKDHRERQPDIDVLGSDISAFRSFLKQRDQ